MPRPPRHLLPALAVCLLAAPAASAQTNFTFQLFGQDEVPPVVTEATGSCIGVLSEDEEEFVLSCDHDVEGAVAAHIHRGFAGENGPILLTLTGLAEGPIQNIWEPTPDEVIRLKAGGLYVNIHTAAHPDGEVRGQILADQPLNTRRVGFPLTGAQEVPPVATLATGACVADVDLGEGLLGTASVQLRCAHDVVDPTGSHVHQAARGVNGPIIVDLGDPASPIEHDFELDLEETGALVAGNLYVNVHSEVFPNGEIRGQIPPCFAGPSTLCLNDGRFEVELDWETATEGGVGRANRETDDSGTFWFFRPTNLEMLVKVLDGCPVNGHFWVFFAATTNVGFELTVTDTRNGQTKTYANPLGNNAEPVLDTAAFATCP